MNRDMELCRKILFAIEEKYIDTAIYNLPIDSYSMEQVAYHCKILNEAKLISDYQVQYADGHIFTFGVGALTWEGNEYLDTIRNETIWNNTKEIILNKGCPIAFDVIKAVVSSIISRLIFTS